MYFPAPPSSSKQIIVLLKHFSMLPQNKSRLIFGRPTNNWHWTLCRSLPLPSNHLWFSNMSSRRLEDVVSIIIFCLPRVLQDVFAVRLPQTSSRRLRKTSSTRFQNVFKMSSKLVSKTSSSSRLEEVFSTSSPIRMFAGWVYPSISCSLQYHSSPQAFPAPLPLYVRVYARQHLTNIIIVNMVKVCLPVGKKIHVLNMSYQDKQDIWQMSERCLKRKSERHLCKASWRYLCKIYCRCLTEDVLKMSY